MRHKGLSLIEILVVIAIIAILLAIAVPALQKCKKQGKDLVCANNLRQLGLAVSIYAQEKTAYPEGFCGDDTCHPPISGQKSLESGISNTKDWMGYWWFCFLADTIGDDFADKKGVLWCPSKKLSDAGLSRNILCGNYGINYSICKIIMASPDEFSGRPFRPERVGHPSAKLILMDSGYALTSWKALAPDTGIYPFENPSRQNSYFLPGVTINEQRFEDGTINQFQQDDAIGGRHSLGKINAVFADGHVDRIKPSSVEPTFDAVGNILSSPSWSP